MQLCFPSRELLAANADLFGDDRGFGGIGHGIANRWEISVEIEPHLRSSGNAQALLNEAIVLAVKRQRFRRGWALVAGCIAREPKRFALA